MKLRKFGAITLITLFVNGLLPSLLKLPMPLESSVFAQTVDEREREADRLSQQGNKQFRISQFREALQLWQQALVIYSEIGDRKGEAHSLGNLGAAYSSLGHYQRAIDFYQRSLAIKREIGDRKGEANSLGNLGLAYRRLGEYDQAIDFYQQALAIDKETGDRRGESASLNGLGDVYSHLGDYQRAIDFYQQSLAIQGDRRREANSLNGLGSVYALLGEYQRAIDFHQQSLAIKREIGDRRGEAASLGNLGNAYESLGEYQRAIDFHQQSLAIKREIGDRHGEANALNGLGHAYESLANYKQAINFYQQSLAIKREIGDRRGEANSLGNLGLAYYSLADYKQAIDFHQQALAIDKEIGGRHGEAASLGNLGNAYYSLADYKQAIDFHQQSLAIKREIGDRHGEANSLGSLGVIYDSLEEYQRAISFHQQSLVIFREIASQRGEVGSLGNLGNAYYSLGNYQRAIDFYQQSLVIGREIGGSREVAYSLNNLGFVLKDSGNLTEAKIYFFQAINIFEEIREILGLNDAWKVSIFETQATTYRGLQNVLVAQNKPQKALEISEQGRARALVELSLRKLSPQLKEEFTPQSPNLEEIKAIAKERNATLVEYSFISDSNQLYIWVIPPDGEIQFRSVNLPQDTSLKELVQASRQSLGVTSPGENDSTLPNADDTNYQRELYQLLIAPIAEFLPQNETERIIFIPDKELFLIPFAALQNDNHDYLIEKHTILTAPSIQALSLTRQHRDRVQQSSGKMLIVGNPEMPANPEGKTLLNLSWAEREAKAVAEILKTKPLLGSQATEPAILEKMADAKIIHLATHGILGEVDGSPGAIALTPAGEDDGYLTTREIMESFGLAATPPLQAELVVLSACDTGSGEIKSEGVVGLSRSLIAAGVPTIVVSLWQVPDDDTNLLMTEFYTNLYKKKLDKAQAMRQAMLTMLKEDRGNFDPKAWAAFTVIGEAE